MYSDGREKKAQLHEQSACIKAGCTFNLWQNAKSVLIPSIVDETHYEDVKNFFQNNYGIETKGYI